MFSVVSLNIGGNVTTYGGMDRYLTGRQGRVDVMAVQEVRVQQQVLEDLVKGWGYRARVSLDPVSGLGVGFLWREDLEVKRVWVVEQGRILFVDFGGVAFFNVYGPSGKSRAAVRREFYGQTLFGALASCKGLNVWLVGDYNCVLQEMDASGNWKDRFCPVLGDLVGSFGLVDGYRTLYPDGREYTWIREGFSRSRLDRVYLCRREFSVRQGDPIAMILYVIFLEPLLMRIRDLLPGVWVGSARLTHEPYADDISGVFTKKSDLTLLGEVMGRFERASGALVNPDKCWVLGLGGHWLEETQGELGMFKLVRELKILGIVLKADYDEMLRLNWEKVVGKVRKCLAGWRSRVLPCLKQRRDVLEIFALSKMWYVAQVLPMPESVVEEVESLVGGFLWSGSAERVSLATLKNREVDGGLAVTDIRTKADSLILKTWVRMMLRPRDSKYFLVSSYWLGFRLRKLIPWLQAGVSSFHTPSLFEKVKSLLERVIGPVFSLGELGDLTAKVLYKALVGGVERPTVESKRVGMVVEWSVVWRRLGSPLVGCKERDVLFRLIHNVLPTRERLCRINIVDDAICPLEGVALEREGPVLEGRKRLDKLFVSGPVQDRVHVLCDCSRVVNCWAWVRNVVVWELLPPSTYVSDEELILLAFPEVQMGGLVIWLVSAYVAWAWGSLRRRTGKLSIMEMVSVLKAQYRFAQESGLMKEAIPSLEP